MISIEEARNIIQNQSFETNSEVKKVENLENGDVTGKDIHAPVDLPLFSNSMMDGYVVSHIAESYEVVGEIKAGDTDLTSLKAGQAFRIFTGAPIPSNSLAVIMQEKALLEGNIVSFTDAIVAGKNIRVKGDEVKVGSLVLPKGTTLTPGVIGFLATMGIAECEVFKKPNISILSTGNECKAAGTDLKHGEIFESNGIMLEKALDSNGFKVAGRHHSIDTYEATKSQIEALLEGTDVLIVTGGISVGDHDYVGRCLNDLGVEKLIYKIKQKPGKPFYFGRFGNKIVLALPGNPASALTCLYQYGIPACKRLGGTPADQIFPAKVSMNINHDHVKKGERPEFLRSYYGNDQTVQILTKQRSSMLHSYALANCLVMLPEGTIILKTGDIVTGYLI